MPLILSDLCENHLMSPFRKDETGHGSITHPQGRFNARLIFIFDFQILSDRTYSEQAQADRRILRLAQQLGSVTERFENVKDVVEKNPLIARQFTFDDMDNLCL